MIRTGKLPAKDATLSHHRPKLVRKLEDGTIEYLVGDSARSRDGWAALPADLAKRVTWDVYTISNPNGLNGPAWRSEYATVEAAAEASRFAYGWDEVVLSDSYDDTMGHGCDGAATQSWSAYATQEDCDREAGTACSESPRITEVRS